MTGRIRTTEHCHRRFSIYENFTNPAQTVIAKIAAATPPPISQTTLNQKILGYVSRRMRCGAASSSGVSTGRSSPAVIADIPDRIIRNPTHPPKPTKRTSNRTGMTSSGFAQRPLESPHPSRSVQTVWFQTRSVVAKRIGPKNKSHVTVGFRSRRNCRTSGLARVLGVLVNEMEKWTGHG